MKSAPVQTWSRRAFLQAGVGALGASASQAGMAQSAAVEVAQDAAWSWAEVRSGMLKRLPTRNTFLSQNGGLPDWEMFFGKLVDDYSGGVFNPWWGPLGAMVFHGGGRSATFDNSVVLLDLNDLTFKRLSEPTHSKGGRNWAEVGMQRGAVDRTFDVQHCEYGDGQPASCRSYDMLAILPPEAGGAACGSLLRVASFDAHVNVPCSTGFAHRFDFSSTDMRGGRWMRASTNGMPDHLEPGGCSAYDSRRQRVWWLASTESGPQPVRYLDVAAQRQVQIDLAPGATQAPPVYYDGATLRYDPVRDMLVLTGTMGYSLALACLRCDAPEAGWFPQPLSEPVKALRTGSLAFDRVPELDAYVMLNPADRDAVYVLQPPPWPSDFDAIWQVTRRPVEGLEFPYNPVVGKRWSYCQAVGAFVWMASSTSGVVAYRP